jgi:hypothetical protein
MMAALAGAILIPPAVTDRAKGKADVLLYPVVKPVRSIAASIQRRFGHKPLPPGETQPRANADIVAENGELKQQLTYLIKQLEDLRLVEDERKRLGPLLKYFKPVTVVGGDATPGRDSLGLMPATGVDTAPGAPVMYSDGLAGRMAAGGRVRLITDRGSKITAEFGRIGEHAQWIPIPTVSPLHHAPAASDAHLWPTRMALGSWFGKMALTTSPISSASRSISRHSSSAVCVDPSEHGSSAPADVGPRQHLLPCPRQS